MHDDCQTFTSSTRASEQQQQQTDSEPWRSPYNTTHRKGRRTRSSTVQPKCYTTLLNYSQLPSHIMAHRRNNYTTTTNATSTGSQIMSATAASSAHSAHILYDRSPRQFPFVASNKRYERDFEPADTLVAREVTSPEGSIRDPNGRSPSAPSSMYEKKKRSLYTSGLTTGMKENEMTSLERIRKRNSALSKLETPSRSSFNTIDSPSMPSTTLVTTPAYEDRRSPQIESSPWIPPITPTGFYLQPNASESAKSLTQSQNRRRTAFMRKLSSMSLRGRIADDIWEQASEDKENNDETQSPSTSMKNRPISRGLRRRFAKFMGNPNTGMYSFSTRIFVISLNFY